MTKNFTLCILITVVFPIQQPLNAHGRNQSFATAPVFQLSSDPLIFLSQPSKLISFKASVIRNKILLQWVISENETTDQFAIEKSTDGKNFVMAAVIFGTDKPETDSYEFFDNLIKKNISYRLKIIDKDKKTAYSDILIIKSK